MLYTIFGSLQLSQNMAALWLGCKNFAQWLGSLAECLSQNISSVIETETLQLWECVTEDDMSH